MGRAHPAAGRGLRRGTRGRRIRGAPRRRPDGLSVGTGAWAAEESEHIPEEEAVDVEWSGNWVAERLGVELVGDGELRELLGLALRRNPKRAHLLVSNVLGKHVPQRPSVVHGVGVALGERVRDLLGDAVEQTVIL